jgi:hypothetical protein
VEAEIDAVVVIFLEQLLAVLLFPINIFFIRGRQSIRRPGSARRRDIDAGRMTTRNRLSRQADFCSNPDPSREFLRCVGVVVSVRVVRFDSP